MPGWLVFSRVSVLVQGQLMRAATVLVLPILTWVRETELASAQATFIYSPMHRCGGPSKSGKTDHVPTTDTGHLRQGRASTVGFPRSMSSSNFFFLTHMCNHRKTSGPALERQGKIRLALHQCPLKLMTQKSNHTEEPLTQPVAQESEPSVCCKAKCLEPLGREPVPLRSTSH